MITAANHPINAIAEYVLDQLKTTVPASSNFGTAIQVYHQQFVYSYISFYDEFAQTRTRVVSQNGHLPAFDAYDAWVYHEYYYADPKFDQLITDIIAHDRLLQHNCTIND